MARDVEAYWSEHTVNDTSFKTKEESLAYLAWRSAVYPMAYSMLDLYGRHEGQTILDFGCGPGNDLVGFLEYSGASKVIGMDVSQKALRLSRKRLKLHRFGRGRSDLVLVRDDGKIPLKSSSIDHINCQGVLHHVTHPEKTLQEFRRVLKPGGTASIMVYNRDSLFFHLYVAYERQILNGDFRNLSTEAAFARMTDGEDCPKSIAYKPYDFVSLCEEAGFSVSYKGGFFADIELEKLSSLGEEAKASPELDEEHKAFIRSLGWRDGFPLHDVVPAGVGGVYLLSK